MYWLGAGDSGAREPGGVEKLKSVNLSYKVPPDPLISVETKLR